jgi:hypothetical protein
VVAPDQEADHRDGHRGKGHEVIAEYLLAREAGDDFADHAHRGQDHDVHGRVAVEPEHVLEQHGVAADGRVEDADVENVLQHHQHQRDGHDGRAQDHDDAGGVMAQINSGRRNQVMPGARILWTVTMKFRPVRIELNPARKMPTMPWWRRTRWRRCCCTAHRTSSPCPRRRQAGPCRRCAADDVEIPAQQIDARKGQIARPDHQRNQKIPQRRRDRRDQEKEDHHHAVRREQLVVGFGQDQIALGRHQIQAHHHRGRAADEEEKGDRKNVEDGDPLVVLGQQPALDRIGGVQIRLAPRVAGM